jgi:hypothetical protein
LAKVECNGFTFLFHYFDSQGKSDNFKEILKTFIKWDGTPEGLQTNLSTPLQDYGKVGLLFEEFIGQLTFFQNSTGIRQESRDLQMAALGEYGDISFLFRSTSGGILSKDQMIEVLTIIQNFPINSRFEIGGNAHLTGFKVNEQHQFEYWDSNFKSSDSIYLDNPEALANFIIKTKYVDHPKTNKIDYNGNGKEFIDEFRLKAFQFQSEHKLNETFNYFKSDQLPDNLSAAQKFINNSPCGFSQLMIAIMTNSKDNFAQLLDCDFSIDMLTTIQTTFVSASPLDVLFSNRNPDMLDLLFKKKMEILTLISLMEYSKN